MPRIYSWGRQYDSLSYAYNSRSLVRYETLGLLALGTIGRFMLLTSIRLIVGYALPAQYLPRRGQNVIRMIVGCEEWCLLGCYAVWLL
jgi:hypothetical protein